MTWTITAVVGADGNWTYDESLASTYTVTTTADGVTGSVETSGSYNYTFSAFSTDVVFSFTFERVCVVAASTMRRPRSA